MRSQNNGFTLIEILVATIILTLGVFGIYKMIALNMSAIATHGRYETLLSLELPLRECLLAVGSGALSATGQTFFISFDTNLMGCSLESSETGITLNETTFFLTGTVLTKSPNTQVEYSITEPNELWHLPEGNHKMVIP